MKLLTEEEFGLIDKQGWEDLTGPELQQYLYARGWWEENFFYEYFLSHWMCDDEGNQVLSPDFHSELRQLQDQGSTVAIVARGYGKTTCGKMRLLRRIVYGQAGDTLLWMSDGLLRKVIGSIRHECEHNPLLRQVYGDLVPDMTAAERTKKWTDKVLHFTNGCTVEGISKFGSVRGGRYDEIWCDDVQENKDVGNPEVAEQFLYHFRSSLIPTLKPNGRIHITGTNVGECCLVKSIYDDPDNTFLKLQYPGVSSPQYSQKGELIAGESLWPERFSIEVLEGIRKNVGTRVFEQEFLNIAMNMNGAPVFDPSDFMPVLVVSMREEDGVKYFRDVLYGEEVIVGIDLARGGIKGDYSTMVGMTREGELVFTYRAKEVADRFASKLDHILTTNKYRALVVPERNAGEAFLHCIAQYPWYGACIYRSRVRGKIMGIHTGQVGWHTSASSKRLMVAQYDRALREGSIEISDAIWREVQVYRYDADGGMNAMAGHHDDLLVAHMIANAVK